MFLGTQCFELNTLAQNLRVNLTVHTQTHTRLSHLVAPETSILMASNLIAVGVWELCSAPAACVNVMCVLWCVSDLYVHPNGGSVPFHPLLVAIQLLTTDIKVRALQTKEQNVLTRASSDKASEECGLRQGCRESVCIQYQTQSGSNVC